MSADEDTELRDLIIHTLETNGVIGKIKAELRACVFLALEDEGAFKDKIPSNKPVQEFISSNEGKKIYSLIQDFLRFYDLKFTLSVFEVETGAKYPQFFSRDELYKEYNLQCTERDSLTPVIVDVLKEKETPTLGVELISTTANQTHQKNMKEVSDFGFSLDGERESLGSTGSGICKDSEATVKGSTQTQSYLDSFDEQYGMNESTSGSPCRNRDCEISKNEISKHPLSLHDPFYDGPLPSASYEQKETFSISCDDKSSMTAKKDKSCLSHIISSEESTHNQKGSEPRDVNYLLSQYGNRMGNISFSSESKVPADVKSKVLQKLESAEDSSLSSLRDLPALNIGFKSNDIKPNSNKKVFALNDSTYGHNSEDSEDSERSTYSHKSLGNSTASKCDVDSHDISERSIEEEIDDISVGIDDLLSSLSIGDETTNDVTVSQMSDPGGYDHLEFALHK